MTLSPRSRPTPPPTKSSNWTAVVFERTMASLATLSLLLVCFDLSYIPLRDFWLQGRVKLFAVKFGKIEYSFPKEPITLFQLTVLTDAYDQVKGIEPYRETEDFLTQYENFKDTLILDDLESPQVEMVLADLRMRSEEMIDTNPFQIANKTGTLERIKNLMRDRVGTDSAKEAFNLFWSLDYLKSHDVSDELEFFEQQIQPLIETNYFRPLGENGRPVDNFGILDFPIGMVFFAEFMARTWFISQRRKGVSWIDAMLWRWYDVLLFFPFPYWLRFARLLRVIPVTIRLHESKLIDLQKIKKQASQGFVAGIAEDLTEVVVVGVLNQVQGSIRRGEFTSFLAQQNQNAYIDLNDTNEIAEMTRLVTQLLVNRVIPAARKDLETLLEYSVDKVFKNSPLYRSVSEFPGIADLKENLAHQIIHGFYEVFYVQLRELIETDPEFDRLVEKLSETVLGSVRNEMQTQHSIERMEYLIVALIEEVKINYVQRLSEEDMEELMDQTRALRQVTQVSGPT